MATKTILNIETLLTPEQMSDIRNVANQKDVVRICEQIPADADTRSAHRKYFSKYAYEHGVKYYSVLPEDYQNAILDRVIRKFSIMDLYFRYNEDFFVVCLRRLFSRVKFDKNKFTEKMLTFMSEEGIACLLGRAKMITTDSRALNRMQKIEKSFALKFCEADE